MSENNKKVKGRNWAFVVYPESLPENWQDILRLSGLKAAVSPLHDADLNADESEKKPHYHIILVWESGSTTFNNVLQFTKKLNGTIPIKLDQIRGYYRYLTHEDNPEKAQYNKSDIKLFNGFNIADFVELTKTEVDNFKKEIYEIIKRMDIKEYDDLFLILEELERHDLWTIASNHTLFFTAILKSRRYKNAKYTKTPNRNNSD